MELYFVMIIIRCNLKNKFLKENTFANEIRNGLAVKS